MNWKKLVCAAVAAAAVTGVLAGCGGSSEKAAPAEQPKAETITLKVGATPVPHAEILEAIKDSLAKDGVTLDIVEFNDYVQPNVALNDGELDANYYQTIPYLEEFCKDRGMELVSAGGIHLEPMTVFSTKHKSLDELPDGALIGIPNDPSNSGRALLVLQSAGLIKLSDEASITATPQDIVENPKNLQFSELEAPQLPRSLEDTDAAVININFALQAKLDPALAIYTESKDSPYVNVIAVRKGDEARPEIQKLVGALQTQEVRDFLAEKYQGAVVAAF